MSVLRARLTALQNDRATIVFEDGQSFSVPASVIEGVATPGSEVCLVVTVPAAEDAGRQGLARDLLNEILRT